MPTDRQDLTNAPSAPVGTDRRAYRRIGFQTGGHVGICLFYLFTATVEASKNISLGVSVGWLSLIGWPT